MSRIAIPVLVALLVLAVPLLADMDEALELVERGRAALKASRAEDATALFEEALEAEESCVPARFGLGEALLAGGDVKGAVVAFRHVARATTASAAIPAPWRELGAKARKFLDKHDALGQELEKLIDGHVAKVMKVALKYRTKDPDLTDRALQIVLSLRPEHGRGIELRDSLSRQGALCVQVFDGKQIEDWDGGRSDWWKVVDGVIVAETKGIATYLRNQDEFEGNFDVVMEARIAKVYDEYPFVAIMGAWKAEFDHSRLGTLAGALTWFEHTGEDSKERVFRCEARRLKKPFDPAKWTKYELRYRDKVIEAWVNGRKVHSTPRSADRAGGYVGIVAQGCRAEIRSLDVRRR